MKFYIPLFLLSIIFSQTSIQTKQYNIFKDAETKEINILDFINEIDNEGIFKVEIIAIQNPKYERNKIILVMPCEVEMIVTSKLTQNPLEFKLCKDKVLSNSFLILDKSNPNIFFKHDKFKFIKGGLIIRVTGEFNSKDINTGTLDNNGILREWYDNGELYLEFNMNNGIKNGMCKKWHINGQLMVTYNYIRGKLHGNQKKWYANGNIKGEWNYDNDVLHGISSEWNEDGKIKSIKEYNFGLVVSSSDN